MGKRDRLKWSRKYREGEKREKREAHKQGGNRKLKRGEETREGESLITLIQI